MAVYSLYYAEVQVSIYSDIWKACHDGGSTMPLSCTSYPTHMPLTVNRAGIDTGMQPDTDEAGLL